ncbi:MAG TPA: ATP-binding protein [Oligoflexia bacterium]|nr:ATP-binding protein [Oligoflexia bacterium]HMP47577.1 ATP-binding protein [Oligoflexia bacterium]
MLGDTIARTEEYSTNLDCTSNMQMSSSIASQRERLLAMGQMAASLAHEIRNPLGSMELYLGLLKKEVKSDSNLLNIVEHLMQSICSLNHIVSNCLLFTKDITVRKRQFVSAAQFLRETCRYLGETKSDVSVQIDINGESLVEKKINLSWDDKGLAPFMMDPYILGQILINLLTNAIDACMLVKDENITQSIHVTLNHNSEDYWELSVRDTGIGMDSDVQSRMYDPFFTTKEKGTGLGLAIVHSLVCSHDGSFLIESAPTKGTLITIKFLNINNLNEVCS